jgi:DNA-binding transcriptional LysR family regulator
MSYHLRQLRGVFEDPLLVRHGGKMMTTPLADRLSGQVRGVLLGVSDVFSHRSESSIREFRVAVSDAVQMILLDKLLDAVASEAPDSNLVVRPITEASADALASGGLHLALGTQDAQMGPEVMSKRVFTIQYCCLVSSEHAAEQLTLDEYCAMRHVLVSPSGGRGFVDRILARQGRSRRVALQVPDFAGIGRLLLRPGWVAAVPTLLAREWAKDLPLRLVGAPISMPTIPLYAFWHPRFASDPGVNAFRGIVQTLLVELQDDEMLNAEA